MRHKAVIFLDICARGNGSKVVEQPIFRLRLGARPGAATIVYRELTERASLGQLPPTLHGAEVGLSVNHPTDKRYDCCFHSDNGWFGEERTIEASLSCTF